MEGSCDAPSLLSDSLYGVAWIGTLAVWNEKATSTVEWFSNECPKYTFCCSLAQNVHSFVPSDASITCIVLS